MTPAGTKTARVFCSYSHRDSEFRDELETHLAALTRQQLITFWADREITPGDDWTAEISAELNEADIILLLISAYFIRSDYCYQVELGRALERHREGSAVVIPIFVQPCDWEGLPFSNLQGLPEDGVPVTEYENRETAWALVAKGIRRARNDLVSRAKPDPSPQPKLSADEIQTYEANTYLKHLTAFRAKQLGETFSLKAEINGQTESLDDTLQTWAKSKLRALFLLVGHGGSGKSWAFRDLAATLAERVLLGHPLVPQPIYVPFRALQNGDGITAISNAVPEARGVLERYKNGANTVFLFDGIDEVMLDSLDLALRTLIEILGSISAHAGVAISSRLQLAPELLNGLKRHNYQPLMCTIRPPERAEGLNDVWRSIDYVSQAVQRAQDRDKRIAKFPTMALWSFLTNLTAQMFPTVTIEIDDIRLSTTSESEKIAVINGLVDSGLLTIDSREMVSFAHHSLFEFFYARLLFEELSNWNASHLSRSNLIYSYNINRFLIPMLLAAGPIELTPAAHRICQEIRKDARLQGNMLLSQPISSKHFLAFVEDTEWRLFTGFGQWLTFACPSGEFMATDGTVVPERDSISLEQHMEDDYAVSLSWYDAFQFARWLGASLPAYQEIPPDPSPTSPRYEWTSDWFNESESLMLVRRAVDNNKHGVNPDVRSSEIGFRIQLSMSS